MALIKNRIFASNIIKNGKEINPIRLGDEKNALPQSESSYSSFFALFSLL